MIGPAARWARSAAFDEMGAAFRAAKATPAAIEAERYNDDLVDAMERSAKARAFVGRFAPLIASLGLGIASAEGVGQAGQVKTWQPARGGRAALILPVRVIEVFHIPADDQSPPRDFDVVSAVDLVAVDPADGGRFSLRYGVGESLGLVDPDARHINVFSTPVAWLAGALGWRAAEDRRLAEQAAVVAGGEAERSVPAGSHGVCILAPEKANWPSLLYGKTGIWFDRPAFGRAVMKRLKADRRQELGRLPKMKAGRGNG